MLGVFLFAVFLSLVSIFLYSARQPWWIKIDSQSPLCTYYFGPFHSQAEALSHQEGYLQDLYDEGAQGITLIIERTYPKQLTIFEEETPLPSL